MARVAVWSDGTIRVLGIGCTHVQMDEPAKIPVPPLARAQGQEARGGAIGHSILVIAYHVLTDHEPYHNLGADHDERRNQQIVERRLVHRLEMLGYDATLNPRAPAA